jgi:SAM-dependent methyltransferase
MSDLLTAQETVLDPCCGAGDLLLAIASRLPVYKSLSRTLSSWSKNLTGLDLDEEFVKAAKLRLSLLATLRGACVDISPDQVLRYFPYISAGNFLEQNFRIGETSILMNPPFTFVKASKGWGTGRLSLAAIFLDQVLNRATEGSEIVALLPDVLRSGSNYAAWRDTIAARSDIKAVHPLGLFDKETDIDVFLLRLKKNESARRQSSWRSAYRPKSSQPLSRFFEVHVGSVVPNRDAEEGPWVSYLTVQDARPWKNISEFTRFRRYAGRLFRPPVVVIRRTSRAEHSHRAVATLVTTNLQIAIENHFVVLIPRKGGVRRCKAVVRFLETDEVDNWLNRRIRCRHLTVKAIEAIPVPALLVSQWEA